MLFSTMCWLFCYCFIIIFDTTIHHISYESEDMWLLKLICNYNFMQLCFNLKNSLNCPGYIGEPLTAVFRPMARTPEPRLLVAEGLRKIGIKYSQ